MKATWWLPWLVRWRAWRASRFGSRVIVLKITRERKEMFCRVDRQHR